MNKEYGAGVTDTCINCEEPIVSTGIEEVTYHYKGPGGGPSTRQRYTWTHSGTLSSKCATGGKYAAGNKNPPGDALKAEPFVTGRNLHFTVPSGGLMKQFPDLIGAMQTRGEVLTQYVVTAYKKEKGLENEGLHVFGRFNSEEEAQHFYTKVIEHPDWEPGEVPVLNNPEVFGTGDERL
jgi:hypothetical protein